MHLSLQGSRGQRCLGCRPPLATKVIYNLESISWNQGGRFYRDRLCSVASESQRGFRSLCKVRRCPNLKIKGKRMFYVTVKSNPHDPRCNFIHVSSGEYLFSPLLWCISPQNAGPWSSLVHTMRPIGSQKHCLWGKSRLMGIRMELQ